MPEQEKCPTCGGTEFWDRDGGPGGYHDDITWTDRVCRKCGTYEHGWTDQWLDEDGEPVSNQDRDPAKEREDSNHGG